MGYYRDHNAQLLLYAGRGDVQAFAQLHATLRPAVHDFLISIEGSISHYQHEDMVQEVFLRVWRSSERFKGNSSAKTYLFAIAKNVFREELSCHYREPAVSFSDSSYVTDTYASEARTDRVNSDQIRLARKIKSAVAKLSNLQRQAFELVCRQGVSPSAAAELMGCSRKTCYKRLYMARKKLQEFLAKE